MMTDHTSKNQNELDPQLLGILCCPESKQKVTLLDSSMLDKLNQNIQTGEIQNQGGSVVKEILDGGLLRDDKTLVYPIRDSIPIMLIEEGIPVQGIF